MTDKYFHDKEIALAFVPPGRVVQRRGHYCLVCQGKHRGLLKDVFLASLQGRPLTHCHGTTLVKGVNAKLIVKQQSRSVSLGILPESSIVRLDPAGSFYMTTADATLELPFDASVVVEVKSGILSILDDARVVIHYPERYWRCGPPGRSKEEEELS